MRISRPLQCIVFLLALAKAPHRASAVDRDMLRMAPDDALVVWLMAPTAGEMDAPSPLASAAAVIEHSHHMGLLSGLEIETRWKLELISLLPIVREQPAALMLLDIASMPHDADSHRLKHMKLALVLRTDGQNDRIAEAIQRCVKRYTNDTTARITSKQRDESLIHTLTDDRLPPWAVIEWGVLRDDFVIALGEGAFESVVNATDGIVPGLSDNRWMEQHWNRIAANTATHYFQVDIQRLQERLRPSLRDIPSNVLNELAWSDVSRFALAANPLEDSTRIEAAWQSPEGVSTGRLLSRPTKAERATGLIPPDASKYHLIRWRPQYRLPQLWNAYLSARSESTRESILHGWQTLEEELHLSIERDILQQLGPRLLIHNDPPHPFDFGFLSTVQIEISGSARAVRSSINAILRHISASRRSSTSQVDGSGVRALRQDNDGVWYLQIALYGPALAVSDEWIILGVSPHAVRKTLERLNAAPPTDSRPQSDAIHRSSPPATRQ